MYVIEVENLSKKFIISHEAPQRYRAMRDVISDKVKGIFTNDKNKKIDTSEEFWALKDVSFNVDAGDRVGIIGRNGAGKSTLLKILSRITPPTSGKITIRGRVSSLLEVGTGFHPELTGRENIFLNGAILGMSRVEIQKKFDEIVDFAEVEKFLDTPVKRYSSGMYVRLAFAVAAHLEPEILIVDEVLAVGDAQFQKKCLGKMKDVSKNDGRTVLFVSHDMNSVSLLTQKAILLKNGKMHFQGDTSKIINAYLQETNSIESIYKSNEINESLPQITYVKVITSKENQIHICGDPLYIEFEINSPEFIENMAISFQVVDEKEESIVHIWHFEKEKKILINKTKNKIKCIIPKLRLYFGKYYLNVYLGESTNKLNFQVLKMICPFSIEMYGIEREYTWKKNDCKYLEDAEWKIY